MAPPDEQELIDAPAEENLEPLIDPNIIPDEFAVKINSMIDDFDNLERPVRWRMIRFWKKCELFWKGVQNLYWDYNQGDWRTIGSTANLYAAEEETNEQLDFYYQDKIVNIFRAHGESVISALSQEVPTVIFPPDDADNIFDVQTAKGYTEAAKLLQKCNDIDLMTMYCLYILWNQGVVGALNYNVADFEFGSYPEPQYEDVTDTVHDMACPICGADMGQSIEGDSPQPQMCPYCNQEVAPISLGSQQVTTSEHIGDIEKPKERQKIELYGPLYFRIPHYVTHPKYTPYVMLDVEAHIDYIRDLFPDAAITEEHNLEKYDRWARTNPDYKGELPLGLVTYRRVWFRPWTYNRWKKDEPELYQYCISNFPEGMLVHRINDRIMKIQAEDLDEHWTFSLSPLSSHIHSEPLGAPLLPIQEMRNELVVLKLQTVEYGIPETFADPAVLDFNEYNKEEVSPGQIYPAKAPAGGTLESGFATLKTAQFPKEANDFQNDLDQDGQFVTGAFPSIYGGSMPSASKTAAEYQMSRNQALQRLQTTWKLLSKFWAKVMDKSVRAFIQNMSRDEQFVQKKDGSYINVYIRQNELTGRVGSAEPELASTFPMSWMQKRDVLMQLLQLNNEYINQALFDPANTGLLSRYMGFRDFYIPGDDARTKQMIEIQELLGTEPIEGEMDIQSMQPQLTPTVEVDPQMDNHQVEYETCVTWMNSEIGMEQKKINPAGYMNVRAHALQHYQILAQMQQAQQEAEQNAQEDSSNEFGSSNSKPSPSSNSPSGGGE